MIEAPQEKAANSRPPGYHKMVEIVRRGRCAAFIGAGTSMPVGYPGLSNLLDELAREANLDDLTASEGSHEGVTNDWMDDFQRIKNMLGDERYRDCLMRIFDARRRDQRFNPILLNILAIPFCAFVTTNFDRCLEFATSHSPIAPQTIPFTYPNLPVTELREKNIFHVHGMIDEGDPSSIKSVVLTKDEYAEAYEGHGSTAIFLRALFSDLDVVFIGFGWTDFVVLDAVERARECNEAKDSFAYERNLPMLRQRHKFAILDKETYERDTDGDDYIGRFGIIPIVYSKPHGSHNELNDIIEAIQTSTSDIPVGPIPSIPEDYLRVESRQNE